MGGAAAKTDGWRERRSLRPVLLAIALGSGLVAAADAQNVVVEGIERGQGLLTRFGTRCVVLTAAHVMRDAGSAVLSSESVNAHTIIAKLVRAFPFDVAVLEPDPPITDCDGELAGLGTSDPFSPDLTLRMVEPNGLAVQHSVTLDSDDGIIVFVRPAGAWTFQPGMSGATLAMDGEPVAMLLAVVGDGSLTEAIRLDAASRWMVPYLRPSPMAAVGGSDLPPAGELLSDPEAGAVAETTAAPVEAGGEPANLLNGPSSPWRGRIVVRPVEVTITLAGGVGEVRCVAVEPGPDTPPTAMPRTIAVFYRVGEGNWRQAGWGEPTLAEGRFSLLMATGLRASAIKLQLGDPADGSDILEIGQIAVLSAPCAS